MTYSTPHIYTRLLFDINGTEEVAQTGFRAHTPGMTDAVAVARLASLGTTYLAQVAADYQAEIMDETLFGFASYGRFVGIEAAALDISGDYLTEKIQLDITPRAGSKAQVAAQCTTVLGLRSGSSFGRANYGRMYLPYSQPDVVGGTPQVSTANAGFMAAAGASFLSAVNDRLGAIDPNLRVVIMSSVGSGTTKEVTSVAVDTITDTQRRRTRQLDSTYATSPLT